jgi:hypothetical protein
MENQLQPWQEALIRNSMLTMSDKAIAEIVGVDCGIVHAFVDLITSGTDIVTKQQKLDKALATAKERRQVAKALKPKVEKPKKVKVVEPKIISKVIAPMSSQSGIVKKERGKLFETKQVDYKNNYTHVKIDSKTHIVVKNGYSIEDAVARFHKYYGKYIEKTAEMQSISMI